jgi:oligo-1,6-glucosidase
MAYAFEGVDVAKMEGYSVNHFKEVFSRWDSAFAEKGWLSIFLANHDQARMVSRFGNDKPAFREVSSKMLSTFIMTMRGTPYYYNGDELGMTNVSFDHIEDYRDMPTLNEYRHQLDIGGDMTAFMKKIQFECRDNGRTPFQWDSTTQSGFTSGTPWIKVNSNYDEINVALQEKDPNSCLNYFRKLTTLRKANPALVYGKYTLLLKDNPKVYAYTREWEGKKFIVLLNFTATVAEATIPGDVSNIKLQVSNYPDNDMMPNGGGSVTLKPYAAAVYLY